MLPDMLPNSNWKRLLYEIYARFAILLGVTAYRYDFVKGRYITTRFMKLLAIFGNICSLLIVPFNTYLEWISNKKLDNITVLTLRINSSITVCCSVLPVLLRFPRDRINYVIARRLERIRRVYRVRLEPANAGSIERLLDHIYLVKNTTLWLLVLSVNVLMMNSGHDMELDQPWLGKLLVLIYACECSSVDLTNHMHFLFSLRICRIYLYMNLRLRQIIHSKDGMALELHQMRWLHWQLADIIRQLSRHYGIIIIASRLGLLFCASTLGYNLIIFSSFNAPLRFQVFGCALYVLIALDTYLHDLLYDMIMQSYRETTIMLRDHSETIQHRPHEDKECEMFALQIASIGLRIDPCGLFVTGRATWLGHIVCILSWMVVLLQSHLAQQKITANIGPSVQ